MEATQYLSVLLIIGPFGTASQTCQVCNIPLGDLGNSLDIRFSYPNDPDQ